MTHQGKAPVPVDPMLPRLFEVERKHRELSDTVTLVLRAQDGGSFRFEPGQFNMLYVFGVGEVPISISGDPADSTRLVHTVRAVGTVSAALANLGAGDMVGVRGPFGSNWPVAQSYGRDILLLAGGVGIAPLRPAIHAILAERQRFGNVLILYGARTPEDILFAKELREWRGRFDMNVQVTVDRATGRWSGRVGVVTNLVATGGFDRREAVAFLCGPELMMRYGVDTLHEIGIPYERIHVSLERNMKCAVGFCGHCQMGGDFVCKDGPVFRFDRIRDRFHIQEL